MKKKEPKQTLIKQVNDADDQIRKFVIILTGVAVICVLSYLFTAKFLVKDKTKDTDKKDETSISYDNIRVGNIFNRPYDSYYVLATDLTKDTTYQSLVGTFTTNHSNTKVYFIDLSLSVNKEYIGKSNKNATKASEIKLSDPTLIKIKNGKIVSYLDNKNSIENELNS